MSVNSPHRTVRWRLTARCAALFALTGTAMTVITYVLGAVTHGPVSQSAAALGTVALLSVVPGWFLAGRLQRQSAAAAPHEPRTPPARPAAVRLDSRVPVDVARIARETVTARAEEAAGRDVTFESYITSAVIAGHRGLAERLVANLVDNALRYNEPGGWIRVSTATAGSRAGVVVANSGPVVPPETVESLLGGTRTPDGDDAGLGLLIVRAVADAHDATVDITAPATGGLAVTVSFPSVTSNIGALTK